MILANCELLEQINKEKRELENLVSKKNNIQDEEVYRKSVELDDLVVKVMRKNLNKLT